MNLIDTVAILNLIYLILNTGGFFTKSSAHTKALFSAANLFMAISTLIAGSLSTAILCAVTALRILVSMKTGNFTHIGRFVLCSLFCVLHMGLVLHFWQGHADFLVLALGVFTTVVFFYASDFWLRICLIVSCLAWAVNGLVIENPSLVLGQLPGILISGFLAYKIAKTASLKQA